MNVRLHHNTESGSTATPTTESPLTAKFPPKPLPTDLPAFDGRDFDLITGLQNNLNRWYDPTPGRYLSEDPIGFDNSDENLTKYVGQGSSPDHKV